MVQILEITGAALLILGAAVIHDWHRWKSGKRP